MVSLITETITSKGHISHTYVLRDKCVGFIFC